MTSNRPHPLSLSNMAPDTMRDEPSKDPKSNFLHSRTSQDAASGLESNGLKSIIPGRIAAASNTIVSDRGASSSLQLLGKPCRTVRTIATLEGANNRELKIRRRE